MSVLHRLRVWALLPLIISVACVPSLMAKPRKSPPNIIVILVDDMGYSDISSFGGEIPTPNLDTLADNGLRYSQFYNMARCSPTRAALLTGLYPHAAGLGYLESKSEPDSKGSFGKLQTRAVTMAEVLGDAGYLTAITGKWHLGMSWGVNPWDRGFQRSLVAGYGEIFYPDQIRNQRLHELFDFQTDYLHLNGEKIPLKDKRAGQGTWYGTDLWTRWGTRFIDEAIDKDKPFFLYLAHITPHFPVMAPEEDIARFRGRYLRNWEELRERRFERQKAMGLHKGVAGLPDFLPEAYDWDKLNNEQRQRFDEIMAIYAASISRLDYSVGDLVFHLKDRGVFDNTLIMFMSDNGGNAESGPDGRLDYHETESGRPSIFPGMSWATVQNTPFSYFKHHTQEGGIATPMIAHWPNGIAKSRRGKIERTPLHVVDIMATTLDITGAKYPKRYNDTAILPYDGVSFAPTFKGRKVKRGRPIYWEHEGNKAIRDGAWKAVGPLNGKWELYNIEKDRTEMTNLAAKDPERLASMKAQWEEWAAANFVDEWIEEPGRRSWGGHNVVKHPEAQYQSNSK